MITEVTHYNDLTKEDLYRLVYLRTQVFIVEQNCPYQDLDDLDKTAHHVFGTINDDLIAVGRIISVRDQNKVIIGRIAVCENFRKMGYARKLMEDIMQFIHVNYNLSLIELSAQLYLKDFYSSMGFIEKGDSYLEDGIPHIYMYYN